VSTFQPRTYSQVYDWLKAGLSHVDVYNILRGNYSDIFDAGLLDADARRMLSSIADDLRCRHDDEVLAAIREVDQRRLNPRPPEPAVVDVQKPAPVAERPQDANAKPAAFSPDEQKIILEMAERGVDLSDIRKKLHRDTAVEILAFLQDNGYDWDEENGKVFAADAEEDEAEPKPRRKTATAKKSARVKALELLKSVLPEDQLAAVKDILDYDSEIPYLLPFPDAPDEYDLDPWGVPYAKTSKGRRGGKIRVNRSQKKKSKKWATGYRLTIDGDREDKPPRYLLIARTIAEREFWRESQE